MRITLLSLIIISGSDAKQLNMDVNNELANVDN